MDKKQFDPSKSKDYFVRLNNETNVYLHPDKNSDNYVLLHGAIGACIFTEKNADNVIKSVNANNLEKVLVSEILK
jgi:hypothetical protein